jgi:hypothetical protein
VTTDPAEPLTREGDPRDRHRHVASTTPAGVERLQARMAAQRAGEDQLHTV